MEFSGVVLMDYETKEEDILKIKKEMRVDQGLVDIVKKNVGKYLDNFSWFTYNWIDINEIKLNI